LVTINSVRHCYHVIIQWNILHSDGEMGHILPAITSFDVINEIRTYLP